MDEHGQLTAYRYDGAGRLEKALYSFGTGKASEDFDERLRAGLYPVYEKTGGPGSGDKAGTSFGFELPQVEDLDKESFSKELSEMLHGKSEIYHKWHEVMPNHWGRWHLVPGEGATAFAERIVPAGMEKQMLEAAARRAQKRPYPFSRERWLWVEQYAYDANNNRTRKANGWGAIDYEYDVENRLMKSGQREYGWDENGNMITEKVGKAQAVYEYGADNRVVDVNTEVEGLVGRFHRGWSSTLKSGVRYEYDALGRRVTSAEYEAKESSWHQVKREWSKDTVTEYQYDGLGMDVLAEYRNTDYNPDLGNPWLPWYGWMGHRPWWGHHRSHPGYWWWWQNPHQANSKYRPMGEYTYGNGLVSRTDWDPGSTHRWWGNVKDREYYHRDLLGSTALLTDKFGMVRERYRYDAFGNHYAGTFKRFNELGYTGKRYDGTTGLYNYGFRDYDAESGRFTTVDPIRDGSNWYAYCGNDPVNKVDLWGLEDIVVMFLLNQEEKDLNAILYNLVVDQSAMDLETAAAIAGKTIRVDRDATLDEITAAYEDGDTERLILVAHGYNGEARLSNIDNKTNPTGTITPQNFDSSKKGAELTTVDIVACYQNTTNANVNLEAQWEARIGTNVNTYNPNGQSIHWNQTNQVLQDQIPSQIRGSEPLQPTMPAPNPVTSWLMDVVGSGDTNACGE